MDENTKYMEEIRKELMVLQESLDHIRAIEELLFLRYPPMVERLQAIKSEVIERIYDRNMRYYDK